MNDGFNSELFRERLWHFKHKRGFSRPDLEIARRADMSVSVIQKLRSGVYGSEIHPKNQKKLAKAIGVALKRLFP